jgi:pimeloyl-ACP methyl ester carboxylesterase
MGNLYGENKTARLKDGRHLGYTIVGVGKPILCFHGTESSRLEVLLFKESILTSGFKLIGVDRPGYGLSTFSPRNNLHNFAQDVTQLADHLRLDSFALLSWSGGGPFLVAYLALFPERVTSAVTASSPSLPFNVAEAHNNPLAKYAMRFPFLGKLALRRFMKFVLKSNKDINKFLNSQAGNNYLSQWPDEDRKFFADPAWLTVIMRSMAEGFRQGDRGIEAILQEHQLFLKNWDLPLNKISGKTLQIWHGSQDKTCRIENAYNIAQKIPGAKTQIFQDSGHCVLFDNLDKLSQTLT